MLKKPFKCQYYLTLDCNARCKFCDFPRNAKYRMGFADFEDIKSNIKDLKKLGVMVIDFTGGEPLLHKDIIKILKFAKKYRMVTRLSTNGILYKKYAKELSGLVNYLVFSIHGSNRETNEMITGTKNFDDLIESVKLAKRLGQNPEMFYVVTEENFEEVEEIVKIADKLNVRLTLNPVYTYFNNQELDRKKLKQLKKYEYKKNVFINLALVRFNLKGGNNVKKPRCRAIDAVINITPDNCLALPCFNFFFKKIKINKDLEKIYKSGYVKKLKKIQGRWDFCKNCNLGCYSVPSFYYRLDKYCFLTGISGAKYHLVKRMKDVFKGF